MRRAAVKFVQRATATIHSTPVAPRPPFPSSPVVPLRALWTAPIAAASQSSPGGATSASRSEPEGGAGQKLIASLLVERLPVVLPKPADWATEYETFSFARRQQYRKTYPEEFLNAASGNTADDSTSSAEDDDWANTVAAPFDAPSRLTEADETNDVTSLLRALDRRLYLVVKSQSGGNKWHFPEKAYEGEDSMRQCAEAAAAAALGDSLQLYFVGNAPCAHVVKGPSSSFLFRAQVISGDTMHPNRAIWDFAWVTRKELQELPEYEDVAGTSAEGAKLLETLLDVE